MSKIISPFFIAIPSRRSFPSLLDKHLCSFTTFLGVELDFEVQQWIIEEQSSTVLSFSSCPTITQVDKIRTSELDDWPSRSKSNGCACGSRGRVPVAVGGSVGVSIDIDAPTRSIDRDLNPITPLPNLITEGSTAAFSFR